MLVAELPTERRKAGTGLLVASFYLAVKLVVLVSEAAKHESGKVLGVQWHPEMLPELEPVFGWLVGAASQ